MGERARERENLKAIRRQLAKVYVGRGHILLLIWTDNNIMATN